MTSKKVRQRLIIFALCYVAYTAFFGADTGRYLTYYSSQTQKKLEFVPIAQTGGEAIEKVAALAGINWGAVAYPPSILNSALSKKHYVYSDKDLFTVVRNPYTRLISEFYSSHSGLDSASETDATRLNQWVLSTIKSLAAQKLDPLENAEDVAKTDEVEDPEPLAQKPLMLPQAEFVYQYGHGGRRVIGNILHFEDLAEEFRALMGKYGLDVNVPNTAEPTISGNFGINHLDRYTIAMIDEFYKSDFIAFGYETFQGFDSENSDYNVRSQFLPCHTFEVGYTQCDRDVHGLDSPLSTSTPSIDDVLYIDEFALRNVHETFKGARSRVEWPSSHIPEAKDKERSERKFQVAPLLATVDRRPIVVKRQMSEDDRHQQGMSLGCAVTSTTFVSHLNQIKLEGSKSLSHSCDICFQFSNREDMEQFLPGVGYEPSSDKATTIATKCFGGKAEVSGRFANWQQHDDRFKKFGYPWTVDCELPNGIQELTCREISNLQNQIDDRDDLQSIYFKTKFTLNGWFDPEFKPFHIFSQWPWTALMSHDDDRSKIARNLPIFWNDVSSPYVPRNANELKLAHVEGPGYDMSTYNGKPSLKSMLRNKESTGGVHHRMMANLFHLIRNVPGSTHIVAVIHGQMNRSKEVLLELLQSPISKLYPKYGSVVFDNVYELAQKKLIPMAKMNEGDGESVSSSDRSSSELTLRDVLRIRNIKIQLVPVTATSQSFEKSVCGGQYDFATYLAARYAADYQVMMFTDGDTAKIENPHQTQTLQSILYNRFFSDQSSKCAGHRLRLIEQYVKPEDDHIDRVMQCVHDLSSSPEKWTYAMNNCDLKEGHIVARADSIYAFNVHHPETLEKYTPQGVDNCIEDPNKDRYFLKEDEFVQLHLRNRQRKKECTCFVNEA